MSQLEDLYKNSKLKRIEEARSIPDQATNFTDIDNQFQNEFTPGEKPGDPTRYTPKALDYYNKELKDLTAPQGQDAPLHRYSPEKPFYNPGSPK